LDKSESQGFVIVKDSRTGGMLLGESLRVVRRTDFKTSSMERVPMYPMVQWSSVTEAK